MKLGHIARTLRSASAALALTAAAFGSLASPARASAPPPPPIQGLTQYALPGGNPTANPMAGYQGIISSVPYGYACLPDLYGSKWFCYFDYFRGWGLMKVDYEKFNWHTGSKLICVKLYHLGYDKWGFPYWIESCGSGSEYNSLFTFALERQGDGLGQLYFEGRPYEWGTYHPVGHPEEPRWFYIQPN